jgi:galactitol-specific phosphotransferase system IIB component
MALWGNKDSKTASGTIAIANTGVVTGSSTSFTTQAKIGNYIRANGVDYEIVTITSNTVAKVRAGTNGAAIAVVNSGTSYTLSEKPAFVAASEASNVSGWAGAGKAEAVYGVDTTEESAGGDNVTDVAVISGGSGYVEVPAVAFSGGGGSSAAATATIAGGKVTKITVTNGGSSYETLPTVNVNVPRLTIPTANISTSTEVITYTGHGLTTGEAVKYYNAGGATATGLTDATVYYANAINANTFYVYDTKAHAVAGGATGKINLSGLGNNAQYFDKLDQTTATAKAAKGSGETDGANSAMQHVTHAGWVRKTVGTGGRAGRVQYETLVAMGTITGDQADDIQFPDA